MGPPSYLEEKLHGKLMKNVRGGPSSIGNRRSGKLFSLYVRLMHWLITALIRTEWNKKESTFELRTFFFAAASWAVNQSRAKISNAHRVKKEGQIIDNSVFFEPHNF